MYAGNQDDIPIIAYWEVCRFCLKSEDIYRDEFCKPCYLKVHRTEIAERVEKLTDTIIQANAMMTELYTSFRNVTETMNTLGFILRELYEPTPEAKEEMDRLGLELVGESGKRGANAGKKLRMILIDETKEPPEDMEKYWTKTWEEIIEGDD